MAAGLQISVDDAKLQTALRRMRRWVQRDIQETMDEIGARLEASTMHRFETEAGPTGEPWKPSHASYDRGGAGVHPRGGGHRDRGQTLTDTGRLRASITRRVRGGDTVEVGTNVVYAAIHQFGGKTGPRTIRPKRKKALAWPGARHPVRSVRHPGSKVPARPFLGISRGDRDAILRIVQRRALRAWR